jgi:hypothetical protein
MPSRFTRPPTQPPANNRPLALRLAGFFALAAVLSFFSLPGWVTLGLLGGGGGGLAVVVWQALFG